MVKQPEPEKEWVPFEAYALSFGKDVQGDIVTKEAVIQSAVRLEGAVIHDRFRFDVTGVGAIHDVSVNDEGIYIKGQIEKRLRGIGGFGCHGQVIRKEGNRILEWMLEGVSWIQTPKDIVRDLQFRLSQAEIVVRAAHRLRALEVDAVGKPNDVDIRGPIIEIRHELDVALHEWADGKWKTG